LGLGTARRECKEDSIEDWREEGEKGEDNEGELIRVSDNLSDKVWIQEKSSALQANEWYWSEVWFK